jgi:hypothetical protein
MMSVSVIKDIHRIFIWVPAHLASPLDALSSHINEQYFRQNPSNPDKNRIMVGKGS